MIEGVKLCLIAARSRNGVIGKDSGLPWRLSDDLKFFKTATLGKPVIMGRKTWESLPKRPLAGRDNIVLSADWTYEAPGARLYSNLSIAAAAARAIATRKGVDEVFVIGGASLYEKALDVADRIYLTEVHTELEGDTRFPEFDEGEWVESAVEHLPADEKNEYAFSRRRLDRRMSRARQA